MSITCIERRMGLVTHSDISRRRVRRESYHVTPCSSQSALVVENQAMMSVVVESQAMCVVGENQSMSVTVIDDCRPIQWATAM